MQHFRELERIDPVTKDEILPDNIYRAALDYLVIACVDVVFTHHDQVLLVKRNRYPRSSWWIVGGRMISGESPQQTAIRKAGQELGLVDLDPDRLQYIGTYSTCFAFRHQPPQHHGSHTLNITYAVELSLSEQAEIAVHPREHETWQWMEFEEAICLLNTDQVMDQALLSLLKDLWNGN